MEPRAVETMRAIMRQHHLKRNGEQGFLDSSAALVTVNELWYDRTGIHFASEHRVAVIYQFVPGPESSKH